MSESIVSPANVSADARMLASSWNTMVSKWMFLGFCWISFAIFLSMGAGGFYLVHPRLISLAAWLDKLVLCGVIVFYFFIGAGLFLITVTAISGIDLLYPHYRSSVTVKFLFPIAATLSQLLGVKRDRLRSSFINVNNSLTKAQRKRINGDRILVLLPHCLQIDVCNRKITNDINNCLHCGRCAVAALLDLGKKYNLKIEVVNGGTLARKKVASFHPDGIVAVACERDLTFGIQDVYPIPVYGVINDRPNGPCYNTGVDMALVEEAVCFFKNDSPRTAAA
jgi:hypothetical protein